MTDTKPVGNIEEIWKPIPIPPWDELYEVSNLGRVRHTARLVPSRKVSGYAAVTLIKQGYKYTVGIHRLIAAAFLRPPKPGEVVNHINANPLDNDLSNLEWVTQGENVRHAKKLGRLADWRKFPHTKINPEIAIQLRQSGASLRAIASHFGCSLTAACAFIKKAKSDGRLRDDPRG